MLFVHQSKWQAQILQKYGNEICLLDATYKTSKFDIPLFSLCVQTNCGYVVVGSFMIQHETAANIMETLHILHDWNPDWCPSFFMTDFDEREIRAIETEFPGENRKKANI